MGRGIPATLPVCQYPGGHEEGLSDKEPQEVLCPDRHRRLRRGDHWTQPVREDTHIPGTAGKAA